MKDLIDRSVLDLIYAIFPLSDYELHHDYLPRILKGFGYDVVRDDKPFGNHSWMYAKGKSPFMMVAHTDVVASITVPKAIYKTVKAWPEPGRQFVLTGDNGLGADDRAGIVAILLVLTFTDYRPDLFFPSGEEVGCVGTKAFVDAMKDKLDDFKHLNFILQFDRKNANDIVQYTDSNTTLVDVFEKTGFFKLAKGSFSDVGTLMPFFNISGLNISTGYFNEHTKHEYLDVDAFVESVYQTINILQTMDMGVKHKYYLKPYEPPKLTEWTTTSVFGNSYTYKSDEPKLTKEDLGIDQDDETIIECSLCTTKIPFHQAINFDQEVYVCNECYHEPSNGMKEITVAECLECGTFLTKKSLVFTTTTDVFGKLTTELSCEHCAGTQLSLFKPISSFNVSEETIDKKNLFFVDDVDKDL